MDLATLPPLRLEEWEPTRLYAQLVCQIIGKTRLKLHPRLNHWWHVPLYLSARGLTTHAIPYNGQQLEIEVDLFDHKVVLRRAGQAQEVALYGQPICEFYEAYRHALRKLAVEVQLVGTPYRCKSTTPFGKDREHSVYDADAVHRAWVVLSQVEGVLTELRGGFLGKCSPVHVFWHSFDIACTRFSGRAAPQMPEADTVTQEAYSHEVISSGFWFGDDNVPEAAFYCYAVPAPEGLGATAISPPEAQWTILNGLPEALLRYEDVRQSADPRAMVLDFLQSSYAAAADLAGWDRAALERRSPYV